MAALIYWGPRLLCLILLLSIARSDFRKRYIYIWQLLGLYPAYMLIGYEGAAGFYEWGMQSLFNAGFLFVQLLLAYIWYRNRGSNKELGWVDGAIGLGDLAFFPAPAFAYPMLIFMWVHTFGLVLVLAGTVLYHRLRPEHGKELYKNIPLAGGLALCWAVFGVFHYFFESFFAAFGYY